MERDTCYGGLTSVSLSGHALLNAGLLLSTLGVAAATAAALAQGILGFVQKAGHVCDCLWSSVWFGLM